MQTPSPIIVSSVDGKGAASRSGITVGDYILKVITLLPKRIILLDSIEVIMSIAMNLRYREKSKKNFQCMKWQDCVTFRDVGCWLRIHEKKNEKKRKNDFARARTGDLECVRLT